MSRYLIIIATLLSLNIKLIAQKDSSTVKHCIPSPDVYEGQTVYRIADQMPVYGKGAMDFAGYISKNLTYTSTESIGRSKFLATFIIDTLGQVQNACCMTSHDYYTPEEKQLIGLIEATHWTPASLDGKNVCVRLTIPLTICLK